MKPVQLPAVSLRIDSLVLPGYSARDGARLAAALEQELGRLLQSAPLAQRSVATDLLRLPRLHSAAPATPERTGQQLARAIVKGLPK